MNPAGSLTVAVRLAGDSAGWQVAACRVALQRPPVARLFIGQAPGAVLKTVPYLYSLCAQAQQAAAHDALAAAGVALGPGGDDDALWREYLHESLWRLLLDWPVALGLPPAQAEFVAWRAQRRTTAGPCPATARLLAGPLAALNEKCRQALVDRRNPDQAATAAATNGGTPDPAAPGWPLPAPADWLAAWRGAAMPATASATTSATLPGWPLPDSVLAAYAARLAGVLAAAAALGEGRPYPRASAGGDGWGVGQILTARGILTHAVHVEEEKVQRYAVWAPTDCHFADAAGLSGLLAGACFADAAAARAGVEQAVLALDPCLPYTVEVGDA